MVAGRLRLRDMSSMRARGIDGFAGALGQRLTLGRGFGDCGECQRCDASTCRSVLSVRPLILCFTLPAFGGGIAVLAFKSLWLVSSSVLPWLVGPNAGSLDGCLRPLGRTFSSCDGGRSMSAGLVVMEPQGSIRPRSTQLQFLDMAGPAREKQITASSSADGQWERRAGCEASVDARQHRISPVPAPTLDGPPRSRRIPPCAGGRQCAVTCKSTFYAALLPCASCRPG